MKQYLYTIAFILLALAMPSIQYADLAGRTYNKKIIAIENMLDGQIPMDIEFARSNLKLLKDRTVSSDRIERINNAYRRFNAFMDEMNRKKNQTPIQHAVANPVPTQIVPVPSQPSQLTIIPAPENFPITNRILELPAPEPLPSPEPLIPQKPSSPEPLPKGMTPEQQLETLLLYVQSLASTVDVAIKVGQKNNAQTILAQAGSQIPAMQAILAQYPQLTQRFIARIQALASRIAQAQDEINAMM